MNRKDPLPEFQLSQIYGNALNWHEWYGQLTSTIHSALLCDDEKLTYLKTLIAKAAIADYSYSGVLYNFAVGTLQRKFGYSRTIVGAHLYKLTSFLSLKMQFKECHQFLLRRLRTGCSLSTVVYS